MKKISLGKVSIVYTENNDGNMRIRSNRDKIAEKFSFNEIYIPNQKHTTHIYSVDKYFSQDADGLYTEKPDTPIGVLTADCMPVVLTDGKVLTVVHVGWKGLFEGILENACDIFDKKRTVFGFIGPSARICCYSVQEDFIEKAESYGIKMNKRYLKREKDSYKFSLQEVAKDKLKESGVEHIVDLSKCTICSNELFSYRKGHLDERILTFAWLTEV